MALGKKLTGIIGEVVLGAPGGTIEPQGWSQIPFEIRTELAARTYGLIRPFKLAVIAGTAIFPTVHIDQLMHWLLPRQSTDRRFLTTYRDVYHLARTFLLILGLRSSGQLGGLGWPVLHWGDRSRGNRHVSGVGCSGHPSRTFGSRRLLELHGINSGICDPIHGVSMPECRATLSDAGPVL